MIIIKHQVINIEQMDGHEIIVTHNFNDTTKKGNILLLHGMAEHHERYSPFTAFLTNQGYDVYRYSHRGHGTSIKTDELGIFSEKDGANLVVQDAISVLDTIHKRDSTTPLFLMGHSMGSLIARNVIQQYDALDGVILCGTANPPKITTLSGLLLSTLSGYGRKPYKKAPFMHKLIFGSHLYKKMNTKTDYDWLCSDPTVIDTYIKDSHCGFVCTKSFYHDLLLLTKSASDKKKMLKTPTTIPFLIISGAKDAVGGYGKDVKRLFEFYKANGYNVAFKLYDDLRHEILNEPKKDTVMGDILDFLNKCTD